MGIVEIEDAGAVCGGDVSGEVGAKAIGTPSGVANAGTVAPCSAVDLDSMAAAAPERGWRPLRGDCWSRIGPMCNLSQSA